MNIRHFFPPYSLCNSGSGISFLSNLPQREDRMAVGNRHRPTRALPSSSLVRMVMRISRARWFSFLRKLFHYQNGSRSDLGPNPFNSSTWMLMEFIALVVQISITTFTIAISKKEKPVWPMRIWIVGYNIGCVLSLLPLYVRYRHHLNHRDGFGLSDVEQQRGIEESRYNMNTGSTDRGASDNQISQLSSWRYKEVDTKLEPCTDTHCNPDLANDDPEFCICLANYKNREELRQLPCSHVFHLMCVDQWIQIISCCPLCKQELER